MMKPQAPLFQDIKMTKCTCNRKIIDGGAPCWTQAEDGDILTECRKCGKEHDNRGGLDIRRYLPDCEVHGAPTENFYWLCYECATEILDNLINPENRNVSRPQI